MTEILTESPAPQTMPDLASEAQRVLAASGEPMTVSKIRLRLQAPFRMAEIPELLDVLQRLVAANVLYQYPKYRSSQERFWDRGMPIHVAQLLRETLEAGPLAWSELRRKLPAYAQSLAESVMQEQLAQGLLHRHPRASSRGSERLGARPADPKDYLRQELPNLFNRLAALGFTRPQVRAAALEMLHDEEWECTPPVEESRSTEPPTELAAISSEPPTELATTSPPEPENEPAPLPLAGPHMTEALQPVAVAEAPQEPVT